MSSAQELMTAKLFMNAAFPTMQVLLDDNLKLHKKFESFQGTVQFGAKNDGELLCCHLIFDNGKLTVVQGSAEKPDLTLTFPSIEKMNALLKGGLALPAIKGKLSMLPNVLAVLLGLKIMTKPNDKLKTEEEKALKVKCSLYMITRALSKYNKLGDPDTNGAITGALLGAVFGQYGIPHEWQEDVLNCRCERPTRYRAARGMEMLEELFEQAR